MHVHSELQLVTLTIQYDDSRFLIFLAFESSLYSNILRRIFLCDSLVESIDFAHNYLFDKYIILSGRSQPIQTAKV